MDKENVTKNFDSYRPYNKLVIMFVVLNMLVVGASSIFAASEKSQKEANVDHTILDESIFSQINTNPELLGFESTERKNPVDFVESFDNTPKDVVEQFIFDNPDQIDDLKTEIKETIKKELEVTEHENEEEKNSSEVSFFDSIFLPVNAQEKESKKTPEELVELFEDVDLVDEPETHLDAREYLKIGDEVTNQPTPKIQARALAATPKTGLLEVNNTSSTVNLFKSPGGSARTYIAGTPIYSGIFPFYDYQNGYYKIKLSGFEGGSLKARLCPHPGHDWATTEPLGPAPLPVSSDHVWS